MKPKTLAAASLYVMASMLVPAVAETTRISTGAALEAALAEARAGDEIVLEAGHYGKISISQTFDDMVTIRAVAPGAAVFSAIELVGARNITLDSLRVDGRNHSGNYVEIARGSRDIVLQNLDIGSEDRDQSRRFGIRAKEVENITYKNNHIENAENGIANFQAFDITLIGNVVDWISVDSYKFSEVKGGLVENNWGASHVEVRPGAHEDFMQFQGEESYDFVIRGNVLLPAEGEIASMQGIFGNLSRSLIEQNIIVAGNARGISVHDDNVIRNNTVLDVPGQASDVTRIYAGKNNVIEDNIWTEKRGGSDGSNVIVQHLDPDGTNYVHHIFRDFYGAGTSLEGLLPLERGAAQHKGAHGRLKALTQGD